MAGKVHDELWDEEEGIYCDRDLEGNPERVQAVSGFFPLMLPDMPEGRAERLVEALNDPDRFNAPFPVPTVAVSDPTYSNDMWRGCMWANTNYLVIHGLRRQGRTAEADRLAAKTIDCVRKYYETCGVLFEFFDSSDKTPPNACDRKGPCEPPYDIRKKVQCIRDYHWTAAVTALLLLGAS
jgi:neutral trehalase